MYKNNRFSVDEADNLVKNGELYCISEGLVILRDVGEDGYWLEYYNVW